MNSEWLQYTTLRLASLLVPDNQRAEWVTEWQSELWYINRSRAALFCLGAFRDALWLRWNDPEAEHLNSNKLSPAARVRSHLESPLSCLALLATLAAVSMFVTFNLPAREAAPALHLRVRDLPGACMLTLLYSCMLLPATLAVWHTRAHRHSMPGQSRLRRGIFLALKITLVQPIVLCGFAAQVAMGQLGGFVGLGIQAAIILGLRWVITDQQQRCPVCLRLLTDPIRIGTLSRTFLEWYGTESPCSRGHGLLHTSENSSGYSEHPQWLSLGESWMGLF